MNEYFLTRIDVRNQQDYEAAVAFYTSKGYHWNNRTKPDLCKYLCIVSTNPHGMAWGHNNPSKYKPINLNEPRKYKDE